MAEIEPTEEQIKKIVSLGFVHSYSWVFVKDLDIYDFCDADLNDEKTFDENLRDFWVDCMMDSNQHWMA